MEIGYIETYAYYWVVSRRMGDAPRSLVETKVEEGMTWCLVGVVEGP